MTIQETLLQYVEFCGFNVEWMNAEIYSGQTDFAVSGFYGVFVKNKTGFEHLTSRLLILLKAKGHKNS